MRFDENQDAYFDGDGQPLNYLWNAANRLHRNYDELIGLIRGIIADGAVVRAEADLLAKWCLQYGTEVPEWPVNAIVKRLNRIYDDGIVTAEELEDLRLLLEDIVGGRELETPKPSWHILAVSLNSIAFTDCCASSPPPPPVPVEASAPTMPDQFSGRLGETSSRLDFSTERFPAGRSPLPRAGRDARCIRICAIPPGPVGARGRDTGHSTAPTSPGR